jgi:hypothetical protein
MIFFNKDFLFPSVVNMKNLYIPCLILLMYIFSCNNNPTSPSQSPFGYWLYIGGGAGGYDHGDFDSAYNLTFELYDSKKEGYLTDTAIILLNIIKITPSVLELYRYNIDCYPKFTDSINRIDDSKIYFNDYVLPGYLVCLYEIKGDTLILTKERHNFIGNSNTPDPDSYVFSRSIYIRYEGVFPPKEWHGLCSGNF